MLAWASVSQRIVKTAGGGGWRWHNQHHSCSWSTLALPKPFPTLPQNMPPWSPTLSCCKPKAPTSSNTDSPMEITYTANQQHTHCGTHPSVQFTWINYHTQQAVFFEAIEDSPVSNTKRMAWPLTPHMLLMPQVHMAWWLAASLCHHYSHWWKPPLMTVKL